MRYFVPIAQKNFMINIPPVSFSMISVCQGLEDFPVKLSGGMGSLGSDNNPMICGGNEQECNKRLLQLPERLMGHHQPDEQTEILLCCHQASDQRTYFGFRYKVRHSLIKVWNIYILEPFLLYLSYYFKLL